MGCDRLPETFHGKEGVDGSSPSEGFTKGQQMAFFVAPSGAERPIRVREPVPKTCPQTLERSEVLAWTLGSRNTEHLREKEVLT